MATELLQPRDLACGNLFQSSCIIQTFIWECHLCRVAGNTVIPCGMWVPVAVWRPCELLYTFYLLNYLSTDCFDDSWRDTFFGKYEHGALWLLICGAKEKHLLLTYLFPKILRGQLTMNKPLYCGILTCIIMAVMINLHIKFEVCSFIRS